MMKFVRNRWAQRALALALIGALVVAVDFRALGAALGNITAVLAIFLVYISVVLVFVSALKWKLFLDSLGCRVSLVRLNALYYVGYFINLVLPSHVGGDAVRSWYAGKRVGQHAAFAATILERLLGLVAMVGLALVSMWFVPDLSAGIRAIVVLMALGLVGGVGVLLSPRAVAFIGRLPKGRVVRGHLEKTQGVLRDAMSRRGVLIEALALSLLFHSVTVVNTCAAAAAVGWYDVPVRELFVVLPIILLLGSLPVTPSGLGIQEGAFVFFLTGLGASPAAALGVGVVLRAKSYLLALIGGAVWLAVRRDNAASNPAAAEPPRL
jgi:uncharacterized membrane protein YbhN (UPF0104 family)